MNEELKIIIKAVTKDAVKPIQNVKKELGGLSKSGKSASSGIGTAMKGVGIAAAAAVAAITAVTAALTKLGKNAVEFNKEYSKLTTAFQTVGASTETANEAYRGFYRFLGDSGKAVEAASHVAKLATGHESLAEWTRISQGVYATFGESLPIEGLTEAANETLRVGKVTGNLADALNWAGVSEDDFNAKLAQTTSYEEREAILRETLNGLYGDAARIYEENNKDLIAYNESQARSAAATAAAGQACIPLLTAMNNLGAAIMTALKPALDAIVPYIVTFVEWMAKGVETIMSFFSALSGQSAAVKTVSDIGTAAKGMNNAASGAGNLASGLEEAGAAAKEAKRHLQGFDELNVLQSDKSSSSGDGGAGYLAGGGGYFDNATFSTEVQEGESKMADFVAKMQEKIAQLKDIFAPTIESWSAAFGQIKGAWEESKIHFVNGANSIMNSLTTVASYILGEFVPNITNSFSKNFAPIFADVVSLAISEAGKHFEWYAGLMEDATNDIIMPTLKLLEEISTDTFDAIGQAWQKYGGELVANIEAACENIRNFFTQMYEEFIKPVWDKFMEVCKRVWDEGLEPLVNRISQFVMRVGTLLLQLYNEVIAPIVQWLMTYIYPIIVDVISNILDILGDMWINITQIVDGILDVFEGLIQFVVGVFTGDWEAAWDGICMFFEGIWDIIVGVVEFAWNSIRLILEPVATFFTSLWEQIKNIFAPVGEWFSNLFTGAWEGIKTAWNSVGNWFSNLWQGIQNAWNGAGTWFSNLFSNAWTGMKNAWSGVKSWFSGIWTGIKNVFNPVANWFKDTFTKAWTNVKNVFSTGGKIFDGIKDGILSGLKTVVNGIIGGINKVIKVPFDGINSALSKLKGIDILGVKPFGWVRTINIPQIPKLATGGIVDSATLAMIGERGKEAVLPLENNTEWMDKLADRIAARNGTPSQIVLKVNEREIGWATINGINQITKQTGALQLVL
jgi:phage-related protein